MNTSLKDKWISDAAYYKSLERTENQNMDKHDWFEAEQELQKVISNRVKSGLVMLSDTK